MSSADTPAREMATEDGHNHTRGYHRHSQPSIRLGIVLHTLLNLGGSCQIVAIIDYTSLSVLEALRPDNQ